ncbi:hypothetical protein FOA52_010849 [Chlamydomonas sp. UWO 241]|nr:hypothetical protein FOA52_010849 [Chlamydomonas sp. UWO 241]
MKNERLPATICAGVCVCVYYLVQQREQRGRPAVLQDELHQTRCQPPQIPARDCRTRARRGLDLKRIDGVKAHVAALDVRNPHLAD